MKGLRKTRIAALLLLLAMGCALCAACGGGQAAQTPAPAPQTAAPAPETPVPAPETPAPSEEEPAAPECPLEDGVYTVDFKTDSSMFHVTEAKEGKGLLTVQDGKMTVHVSLVSKSIVNLFPGSAEDAQKEGAQWLEPTTDSVTYKDGMTEEVYGFDVPVPYLDEEFALALIGTKGKWYDHQVSVTNPEPAA